MYVYNLYLIYYLNETKLICLPISIAIALQLNGCNYYNLILIILFNINYLFENNVVVSSTVFSYYFLYSKLFIHFQTVKCFQVLQCITNRSIKHQSFVYTQLNE